MPLIFWFIVSADWVGSPAGCRGEMSPDWAQLHPDRLLSEGRPLEGTVVFRKGSRLSFLWLDKLLRTTNTWVFVLPRGD